MKGSMYDVIIVGARCSGAALAIYLARSGAKVLLLDKSKLPSDQVLSTHTIHPPGIDILDELGVGKAVREVSPPSYMMRLRKNEVLLDVTYGDGRAEYCPRRKRLDGLLQDSAAKAGAELRDEIRVTDVIEDRGRVKGVIGRHKNRKEYIRAPWVIGADGRHSTIGQLVSAEEYLGYDAPRGMFWAYFNTPDVWHTDDYPYGMYIGHYFGGIRVIFPTDNEQLLIGSLPPLHECKSWKSDPLAALNRDLEQDPEVGPLISLCSPESTVRGTIKERYFFRTGAGAGWALVGDAGHHKEFVIGDGITEALIQAKSLAKALQEGTDKALQLWWVERDIEALPLFFFGKDEGMLGPPLEIQSVVLSKVAQKPKLVDRMAQVMEHKISPFEVFPPSAVFKWSLAAAFRGKPQVLTQFWTMAKNGIRVNKELRKRKTQLSRIRQETIAR